MNRTPVHRRVQVLPRAAARTAACGLLVGAAISAMEARAQGEPGFAPDAGLLQQVQSLARTGAAQASSGATADPRVPAGVRVEVAVGKLDPRLKLAPCARIEPYLPAGLPLWGATRVGLRCVQGPKAWNVSLPITVSVFARSTVALGNLAAGTVLEADQLGVAEVDLAAAPGAAIAQPALVVGRTLSRNLSAGAALRQTDLKPRQWFASGETVRVLAGGPGWQVVTEGQAVGPGVEGQLVRVRTEGGRLLNARPTGTAQVEVAL